LGWFYRNDPSRKWNEENELPARDCRPSGLVNALRNLAAFWNLALLGAVFATLGGFFYAVFLRKILRARRIANVRERRLMREAAERQSMRS
jgi:hypothetical protein